MKSQAFQINLMNLYMRLLQCYFFFRLKTKVINLAQYLVTQKCCYKSKTLATKPEDVSAWGGKNPHLNGQNFNQSNNMGKRKEKKSNI